MPSKEAIELAKTIYNECTSAELWSFNPEYGYKTEHAEALIDTALAKARLDLADPQRVAEWWNGGKPSKPANQAFTAGPERQMAYMLEEARLEGAKAMQEAAAKLIWDEINDPNEAEAKIRALDPQQVINESVK